MRLKSCAYPALLLLAMFTSGCGSFVAHRMVQSPNTYPNWFGGLARVELGFSQNLLTNFPARLADVGPPAARLNYRIVEPANYGLQVSSTNWFKRDRPHFVFNFDTSMPGQSNAWTGSPRGTVILLHGYGLAEFAMVPWALRLAEDGWRCVLVDLRGHGKSTGKRIYYGVQETHDLSQLLDVLANDGQLAAPVSVIGDSYGAALALRWKADELRLGSAVAISPYAELSNAVLNLCHEYTSWLPQWLIKSGLRKLPSLLDVPANELDTTTVLARNSVVALFVAGGADRIAPATVVERLYEQAAPGSELIVVPGATHEALPYYFVELAPAVLSWLERQSEGLKAEAGSQKSE